MDDPIITMEEYIRLEEEKAHRHGRTFNWQTATYGKMEYYEDEDDSFTNFDTEYPAIVFDDTSDVALSWEPTVSPLNNNEIDFEISFDESDDEDYMVIFDKNSFSCKIISVDNLKTDLENENDEVNMPSFPSPKPTIGYIDNLYFFKDFENEFPAIAYNDLKSKSDPLIEPPVKGYTEDIVHNFEHRLETIFGREVNRVHVLDFVELTDGMRQTLADRMSMVYTGDDGQTLTSDTEMRLDAADTLCFQLGGARRRMTWREFISVLGLHTAEEMAEIWFGAYWSGSERVTLDKGDLRDYWIEISSDRDILGAASSYVHIRDLVRRLCHMKIACSISGRGQGAEKVTGVNLFYLRTMDHETANVPYLLAQYLFRHAEGRKIGARLSGGHFIGRLTTHFSLVSDEGMRGLSIIARELIGIDLHELARLNICSRFGDTWAWVASWPERQQAAAAGAPGAAKDAPVVDEGAQAVPAPIQAPQSVIGLRGVIESSIIEQTKVSTWMINCMTQLMDANGRTYQAFDSTLVGSSRVSYQRRVRPRIGDASTSTSPYTDDQPDP
ncbi:hypothetical protein Tco_0705976 [Tanacetum coccineum]|uniref:Uncharacterized protein n=1 Tax=Tanacetum coccineum TaxID=301880 RepID=A0ABQ4Y834_9ASTR